MRTSSVYRAFSTYNRDAKLSFDMRVEREAWGGETGQPLTLKLNLSTAADWSELTLYNYAQPILDLSSAASPGTLLTLNVPIPRGGGYAFSALITHADGSTSTTNALAYYAVGVPEPNGLLLAGIAGVIIGRRRRSANCNSSPTTSLR